MIARTSGSVSAAAAQRVGLGRASARQGRLAAALRTDAIASACRSIRSAARPAAAPGRAARPAAGANSISAGREADQVHMSAPECACSIASRLFCDQRHDVGEDSGRPAPSGRRPHPRRRLRQARPPPRHAATAAPAHAGTVSRPRAGRGAARCSRRDQVARRRQVGHIAEADQRHLGGAHGGRARRLSSPGPSAASARRAPAPASRAAGQAPRRGRVPPRAARGVAPRRARA